MSVAVVVVNDKNPLLRYIDFTLMESIQGGNMRHLNLFATMAILTTFGTAYAVPTQPYGASTIPTNQNGNAISPGYGTTPNYPQFNTAPAPLPNGTVPAGAAGSAVSPTPMPYYNSQRPNNNP